MKRSRGSKKTKMCWKSLDKGISQALENRRKVGAAKQKIRLKAVKERQKKVEKSIDKAVFAFCSVICLIAAWIEVKERRK
ncbi:hypothetical protein EDD76_102336 [Kineothrix alysoides]|uniref:Uncharacterized protein n=1 Tax=Kineothrix alysoides TaxID=1469948 RepID=A0A4V2QCK6_9FIRM|nr:hypothetical protein [Kineothrix alysoides]TCL60637.1 hypothetical protein EDD76_102336 [Kineothrix alysoides]